MKNRGTCDIEATVIALEEAIENRKTQMQNAQVHSASSVSRVVPHLFSEILNKAGNSYGQMSTVLEHSGEFAQKFIKKTQQSVEENPWEALRKVAAFSFGIGLFLSMRQKKSSTEATE